MSCRPAHRLARGPYRRRCRRGATIVEMAIVLMVFLTLVLGMLDLGLGVFHYHVLGQAARQGARQAIVHGNLADRLGPWGPQGFTVTAEDASPLVAAIRPVLAGFDLSQVTIQAEWPDGGNDPSSDQRVRVTVSAPYRPIITFIFGNPTYTLQATSTMFIAH
jgi:Flp pilus assembly protein TadG